MQAKLSILFLFIFFCAAIAFEDEITTTVKPSPYAFSYKAGRFPGHTDRIHSEVSDGSGTVRGSYSYVDPSQQVRTVEYVANEHGFYPSLSHPAPADTVAVAQAKDRHYSLYSKIAHDHATAKLVPIGVDESHPRDTVAVTNAKAKHFSLFEKIAAEHARIAAEREAEKLAYELANPNGLEKDYELH
ncbi:cuticular protein 57A [Arctopsyche grandis]|uniref:cuticular protein 57A n=1 Tax=Arctopsyche grandis TaxID=121162 RepID=UPI00406D8F0E